MRTIHTVDLRLRPKQVGLARVTNGVRMWQPNPEGNRDERRLAAKRAGKLGKGKGR